MVLYKKLAAECFGTFWLVFGGCGAAIFAGEKIGFAGVALAFGLTVLTMAFTIGHISGCHLNPAVSLGLFASGRFSSKDLVPYMVAQCVGAIVAAIVLYIILVASGKEVGGFAANGYGTLSPMGYNVCSAFIAEFVLTFMFLFVIIGSTDSRAPAGFAPIAIGLCLTLIHLISIPITNTSVNPARSISQALFAGGPAMMQLWLFIVAPLAGAYAAGQVAKYFEKD